MNILNPLRSVLNIPNALDSLIQLYHLSFHDFLLSRERCMDKRLQIEEAEAHEKLFEYCLTVMCCNHLNEGKHHSEKECRLKQDICDLGHPGVLLLFAFGRYSGVEIWDVSTGTLRDTLRDTLSRRCSQQNGLFSYEIVDQTATIWNLEKEIHYTIVGVGSALKYSCISPNSKLLATLYRKDIGNRTYVYTVQLWDLSTGLPSRAFESKFTEYQYVTIDFSPNGRFLGLRSKDSIELWDPQSGLRDDRFTFPYSLTFSADSSLLAIYGQNVVRVWDMRAGEFCATLHHDWGDYVEFRFLLPDNRILAAGDGWDLYLWQWRTEPMPRVVQRPIPQDSSLHIVCVFDGFLTSSPDGQLIAAAVGDDIIVADYTGSLRHKVHVEAFLCMTISPDKKYLAVADKGVDSILLIDLETGEIWRTLERIHEFDTVLVLAFSPNNQLLACTKEGEIIIWNLHSRTRPWVLDFGGTAKELAFSVDGSQLRTDIGVMPLPASDSPSQPLSTVPADLIVIEEWVTWKMARILWIPHDY
ncbi:hypothetical protein Egran_06627, partial [Elaphomyces granulatus]